ncbi:MAG: FG-GAP repeat protein [Actinomycetota bacterium]
MKVPSLARLTVLAALALVVPAVAQERGDAALPAQVRAASEQACQPEVYAAVPAADQPGAWTAANPAQGLRATFDADGVEIKVGEAGTLALRLVAWGRGDDLEPVPAGTVASAAGRVEITRGPLVEWYVNDRRGLEQGFTIHERPGSDNGAPLRLVLAMEGGFEISVMPGGRDARLFQPDTGTTVHHTGLMAMDSTGCDLPCRMEIEDERLAIVVEDCAAAYPLTIDPWVWVQQAKLVAADGSGGHFFGSGVTLDGNMALVGARGADGLVPWSGAAYVFTRDGSMWSQQAKLTAADGTAASEFGWAVSVSGDTALVGACWDDALGENRGSAYVFTRIGMTWSQQAKLVASDGFPYDSFGWSVSLHGDTALIGSRDSDGMDVWSGSAYTFTRSGTTWSQQAKLVAPDGSLVDAFGASVSLDGDTALIGACRDDDLGSESGSAYVFIWDGATWTQQAKLIPSDGEAGDWFGASVSLDGDTAVIGAPYDNDLGVSSGSAYVFTRSGSIWSQQAKVNAADGDSDDSFGGSVALDGDRVLIGALRADGQADHSGSAYVFSREGTVWSQQVKLTAVDGASDDLLGTSVAICGNTTIIGADGDDDLGNSAGSAYVFEREWNLLAQRPVRRATVNFRNAGTNPASYVAVTLPVLGSTYSATIDLAGTTGHSLAWLIGYSTPWTWTLGGGQTVLVNPADPGGELLQLGAVPGPVAAYDLPVPADPALAGLSLATQAIHLWGVRPFGLSNAQDLLLGY